MMKAVGLIVEYNPFHNGHLHHLQQSKAITGREAVVAVMSGHFLQRGEPALLDKWTRTEMALAGGCDLVLELPTAYATSSAEWFAYGAAATLQATGVVDAICFGTESGMLEPLQAAAKLVAGQPDELRLELGKQLQHGNSYPRAFSRALANLLQQDPLWQQNPIALDQPNHTLGLHYLIALERLNSMIVPYTIPRRQAQYHDTAPSHPSIASATAIRKMLQTDHQLEHIASYVPDSTYSILQRCLLHEQRQAMDWEQFAKLLYYQLGMQPPAQLAQYREIEEGLEHRLITCANSVEHCSINELLEAVKTKRYTRTKLQRALLAIMLQHRKQDFTREKLANGVAYLRVLGFSAKGQQLLKAMKKRATLPIIHTPAQYQGHSAYLQLDIAATSCYMSALAPAEPKLRLADFHRAPIRV